MSFHAILALTRPTDANAKKARIAEEIVTAAEAVFAEGMLIPEDKEERITGLAAGEPSKG